jgi:trypsin
MMLGALALPLMALALPATSTSNSPSSNPIQLAGREDIVGGTTASSGEFPYIVSLSRSGGSHFCGGVLLNAYTVLTAAHCSVGQSASSVRVRAGTLNWASGGVQVGVRQILVNPGYDDALTDGDLALWRLSSPIAASGSTIGYAALPAQGSDPSAGTTATVAGWGYTVDGGPSLPSALRKVSVPVVSRATCRSQYDSAAITDNMWCAGLAQGGKDSCNGDSGGPIVDAASKTLLGLVSWGYGCADPDYPGVYTRVGNYVNYINSNKWTS